MNVPLLLLMMMMWYSCLPLSVNASIGDGEDVVVVHIIVLYLDLCIRSSERVGTLAAMRRNARRLDLKGNRDTDLTR